MTAEVLLAAPRAMPVKQHACPAEIVCGNSVAHEAHIGSVGALPGTQHSQLVDIRAGSRDHAGRHRIQ